MELFFDPQYRPYFQQPLGRRRLDLGFNLHKIKFTS